MAETNAKKLKMRVISKHDSEANWRTAVDFIPFKGEIIIYDADEIHSEPRVKIGDGHTTVNNLSFLTKELDEAIEVTQEAVNKLIDSGTADPDINSNSKFYFKYSL